MKTTEKSKAALILAQYCEAYGNRDAATIEKLFTEDCHLWGTAENEYCVGKRSAVDLIRLAWTQADKEAIHIHTWVPTPVDANWAAAVCTAKITIAGQEHTFEHLRGSIIIRQENGDWKIAYMHCSFPDYRGQEGNTYPV